MFRRHWLLIILLYVNQQSDAQENEPINVHTNFEPDVPLDNPILVKARQWLALANLEMKLHYAPMSRTIKSASLNPNHLVIPIYRTTKREHLFYWFCPFINERMLYLFRKTSRQDLAGIDLNQARKHRIGLMRGTVVEDLLLKLAFPPYSFDMTSYGKTNFNKLLNDRVEFIVQSKEMVTQWQLAGGHAPNTLTAQLLLSDGSDYPLCAAINKSSSPSLITSLDAAFKRL